MISRVVSAQDDEMRKVFPDGKDVPPPEEVQGGPPCSSPEIAWRLTSEHACQAFAPMGGQWCWVEGPNKVGTWKAFERRREEEFRDFEERGLFPAPPTPTTKKEAYARMERKPDGTGWIFHYRFHT